MPGQSTVPKKKSTDELVGTQTSSALVLCSSGMDSVYNLLEAKKHFTKLTALFFDYRHKACPQEYVHLKKLCKKMGLNFIKADLPWYASLNSTLTSNSQKISKFSELKLVEGKAKLAEWVPNRNAVFVNIGAAFAESMAYGAIIIGINKEEAERYPDNSMAFLERSAGLLEYSTLNKPKVLSYSVDKSKREIYPLLLENAISVGIENIKEYIWSCYDSYEKMCGECESCLRLKAVISEYGQGSEWKDRFLK
jgi:7-cyano-7-deazaguanine synthase